MELQNSLIHCLYLSVVTLNKRTMSVQQLREQLFCAPLDGLAQPGQSKKWPLFSSILQNYFLPRSGPQGALNIAPEEMFPDDTDTDSVCWKLMQVTLAPSCTTLSAHSLLRPGQACHDSGGAGSTQIPSAHASTLSILTSVFYPSLSCSGKRNMNANNDHTGIEYDGWCRDKSSREVKVAESKVSVIQNFDRIWTGLKFHVGKFYVTTRAGPGPGERKVRSCRIGADTATSHWLSRGC